MLVPAVEGVRLHDLRHTFATLQLPAGVHFMQVSKWLGHSTFTLKLDVYGDWIPGLNGWLWPISGCRRTWAWSSSAFLLKA